MRAAALLAALAAAAVAPSRAAAPTAAPDYGILLLAHGGDPGWNAEISRVRAQADAEVPTELSIGMADPATLQQALDRLAARGVKRAIAVPLFVHTRSEILDQTRYALGLSDHPSEVLRVAAERMAADPAMAAHMAHMHMFSLDRVKTRLKLAMTPALDDAPLVSHILLERARGLSRDAKAETVVLVAHGPVDDAAVGAWRDSLARHAEYVRREGGFAAATFAVLRDDAAPPVRAAAVADLRARVAAGAKSGRALVVPVLIARGGIETKLPRDLAGLDYAFDAATLMPHDGFARWILDSAAKAAAAP